MCLILETWRYAQDCLFLEACSTRNMIILNFNDNTQKKQLIKVFWWQWKLMLLSNHSSSTKVVIILKCIWKWNLGQVTKVRLFCYLVLLSNDSKTRSQDSRTPSWPESSAKWHHVVMVSNSRCLFPGQLQCTGRKNKSQCIRSWSTKSYRVLKTWREYANTCIFFFKFTKHLLGLQICFTHSILAKYPGYLSAVRRKAVKLNHSLTNLDISGSPIDFQWGSRKYPG